MPIVKFDSEDLAKTELLSDSHHVYYEIPKGNRLRVATAGDLRWQLEEDKLETGRLIKFISCVCVIGFFFAVLSPVLHAAFPKPERPTLDLGTDSPTDNFTMSEELDLTQDVQTENSTTAIEL